MRLLLDTHVVLWAVSEPERLSEPARKAFLAPRNTLYFSVVSAWEMEIKRSLGKLDVPSSFDEELARLRLEELPVRLAHTRGLRELPDHHRDPFDRLLVAQARAESLVIVTADPLVSRYPVRTMRAG
ncbi:MAG: type II toxin-antitoxin system VapC family toxin [Sandaracinus sp.]